MKLANLAQRNYIEPGRIAYNAAMYVAVEEHNGKEVLVCRPHAPFLQNEDFMEIFSRQNETTQSFTSPNVLQYISYSSDSRGAFWFMSPGKYTSLAQLMVDKPNLRLEEQWVDKTIASLIDVVEYVNSQGLCTLELTPKSILLTKDVHHQVVLMPPLSDFLPLKNEIWPDADEQLPPELFNIEEPDQRADVYGIGRIISYLHPYPSLPFKYNQLVKKAVSERVDARPFTAQKMRSTITTRHKSSRATQIIVSVGVVVALLALLIFFPWGEDKEYEFQNLKGPDTTLFDDGALTRNNSLDPLVNPDLQSINESEKERMLDEFLHDSSYTSMDTATTLSPRMKEYQRQMMTLAAEKFRTSFKLQCQHILKKVYTKENLSNQDKFMTLVREANEQLINLQGSLCAQYQLDPTTASRIAGEVYDEVVEEVKKNK